MSRLTSPLRTTQTSHRTWTIFQRRVRIGMATMPPTPHRVRHTTACTPRAAAPPLTRRRRVSTCYVRWLRRSSVLVKVKSMQSTLILANGVQNVNGEAESDVKQQHQQVQPDVDFQASVNSSLSEHITMINAMAMDH
eukprot:PhM_4_TR1249/c0_g1_i2/m.28409